MNSQSLRLLCLHGVGHQGANPRFEVLWRDAITEGLRVWDTHLMPEIEFVVYDDLFAARSLTPASVASAMLKLGTSGVVHGIGDLFRRMRGLADVSESMRWTAGMVAQWTEDETLRYAAAQRILEHVRKFQPHVICAHSLGSLIGYEAFGRQREREAIEGRIFVSFGSQIGNPFVRSALGGRIVALRAKRWFHLFNPYDQAFTAMVRLADPAFQQLITRFDLPGILDHDAAAYLRHSSTLDTVWREVAALGLQAPRARTKGRRAEKPSARLPIAPPAVLPQPGCRALLVGINDYPNPADCLQGCVNDVFLMSAVLQESGFAPEDIRIVLDDRATAAAIRERMEWLLDGADDGQARVFYYSGHGAQLPGYGTREKVDHVDECLVAHDFQWTRETAFTDDEFYELYSQLPYGAHFLAIFDCCHSGGMTREGGPRVRGLTPPDDIRHRMLRWNVQAQMWESREFGSVNRCVAERQDLPAYFGKSGAVNKLGRAALLRMDDEMFDKARKRYGHKGPFLPVLIEACRENEFAYEYRHGVQSYGAFTYALAQVLRERRQHNTPPTWKQLVALTTRRLHLLRYNQTPMLVGPTPILAQQIPW